MCGWVRNCSDGSVEALVTGRHNNVEEMIAWFHEGSPYSEVENVSVEPSNTQYSEDTFKITY